MKAYIYVAVGGFLGAISRYGVKNIEFSFYSGSIPVNTLITNITGSFLLGLFLTVAMYGFKVSNEIRQGVSIGYLGGFTTFSTLCKEAMVLMSQGDYFNSFLYIILTTGLGLLAVGAGILLARIITSSYGNRVRK